jgi:site-specific DNA-cytosine methylase
MRLVAIDLFTGIGGMTLGLEGAVDKPVAYCDIDAACRCVIARRLPPAPVFEDVRTLTAEQLLRLVPPAGSATRVVVTAGSPCQDISSMGRGAGIKGGERSSLVFDVFRIVKGLVDAGRAPIAIMLENSDFIKHRGLPTVLRLCRTHGYSRVAWVYLAAADVGAHHRRRRWFLLAVRQPVGGSGGDTKATGLPQAPGADELARRFVDERLPRLQPRRSAEQDGADRERLSQLGNSVVPATVAAAWNTLVRALDSGRTGAVEYDGPVRHRPLRLEMSDGSVVSQWSTPMHERGHSYPRAQYTRNRHMLATRVFHERGTMRRFGYSDVVEGRRRWMLNPRWVEALMGFPADWTRCAPRVSAKESPQPRRGTGTGS